MPMIWAHRGASFIAPENTLEAFALANDMEADGIELDVHLTCDGEILVAHDDTVDRCTASTGHIAQLTLAQIKRMDFSNHKPGYMGVRAPTLEEVFALIKPTRMEVNVELKTTGADYAGIEEKCIALAKAMGVSDRVYYSSFNHDSLALAKQIDPQARIAPLYSERMRNPWQYAKEMGAQAIHPHYRCLAAAGLVQALSDEGILCNPWTVDEQSDLQWMHRLNVNAVITNKPDLARAVFES